MIEVWIYEKWERNCQIIYKFEKHYRLLTGCLNKVNSHIVHILTSTLKYILKREIKEEQNYTEL